MIYSQILVILSVMYCTDLVMDDPIFELASIAKNNIDQMNWYVNLWKAALDSHLAHHGWVPAYVRDFVMEIPYRN